MDDFALPSEILPDGGLEIGRVGVDFVDLVELSSVHPLENRADEDIDRAEQEGDFPVVKIPLIEKVAGDGVGVIYLPCSRTYVADGRKGIVAENDRIVLLKKLGMEKYPPFQVDLADSFGILFRTERDEPSFES